MKESSRKKEEQLLISSPWNNPWMWSVLIHSFVEPVLLSLPAHLGTSFLTQWKRVGCRNKRTKQEKRIADEWISSKWVVIFVSHASPSFHFHYSVSPLLSKLTFGFHFWFRIELRHHHKIQSKWGSTRSRREQQKFLPKVLHCKFQCVCRKCFSLADCSFNWSRREQELQKEALTSTLTDGESVKEEVAEVSWWSGCTTCHLFLGPWKWSKVEEEGFEK